MRILRLGAVVAREGAAAEVYDAVLGESLQLKLHAARRLVPDAAREVEVFLLAAVEDFRTAAEDEALLHSETHVDDGRFFLVGEVPAQLLTGDFHER